MIRFSSVLFVGVDAPEVLVFVVGGADDWIDEKESTIKSYVGAEPLMQTITACRKPTEDDGRQTETLEPPQAAMGCASARFISSKNNFS